MGHSDEKITDSTCGLSKDFTDNHDIYILPLNVIVDGKTYKEDIDLSKDDFYALLKQHGDNAKTSQPAYGDFVV